MMAEAVLSGSSDGEKENNEADNHEYTDNHEYNRKLCRHYSRGCSLVSPCCGKVYPCRVCHDEQEAHRINRHAITEIICRRCTLKQPVANYCCGCELQFGLYYFCAICKFYDDENKGQFHCEKCGLCRARGKENFFHCDKCGFCLALGKREKHTCRQNISKNNCPICLEDIHTSRDPAHVPRCGHVLHSSCFKGLMQKGLYQCPQCQVSLVDMRLTWERMDAERESWVMPQQLRLFKVKIHCRDCGCEGETFYHVAGLKCCECGSYNTVRCGSEELPVVSTALLNRYRRGDWRPRSRRSRHREECADLERQVQAAEQRAFEAEQKLSETRVQLEDAEQRVVAAELRAVVAERNVVLAEESAEQAKQAAHLSQRRAELAEVSVADLEKKLEEMEELLELVQATQGMSVDPGSSTGASTDQQELHNAGTILRQSCNSLGSYFITHASPKEVHDLPRSGQTHCSADELSITSL